MPCHALVPERVSTLTVPAEARPNSAIPPDATTWNWLITSWLKKVPGRSAASSFAERPSTTKLLLMNRWPVTEMPVPGTAEVSGKRWLAAGFWRVTAGVRAARSR